MPAVAYPAIVEKAEEGYSVYFPDLPGCTSAGRTITEAATNAQEAINGHISVMTEYGDELPPPSTLDSQVSVEALAMVLVVATVPGRSVRVNITLPEDLLADIDRVATNRSGFLAAAARAHLAAMQPERT